MTSFRPIHYFSKLKAFGKTKDIVQGGDLSVVKESPHAVLAIIFF